MIIKHLPYDIKILETENLKTVYTKNWQIIFWRMSKIAKAPKIIVMRRFLPNEIIDYYHDTWIK